MWRTMAYCVGGAILLDIGAAGYCSNNCAGSSSRKCFNTWHHRRGGIGAYKRYQADKRASDEKTPEPVHEEKSKSDQ